MSNNTARTSQINSRQDSSFSMQMDNATYVIGLHFSLTKLIRMDALCHCVEAYTSRKAQMMSRRYLFRGFY